MLKIQESDIHLIGLQTRFPAKYGIVSMSGCPHAFVRVRVEIDNRAFTGIAADNLPPKWFKKDPDQPIPEETDEILSVIENAAKACVGMTGDSAFDMARQISAAQSAWGAGEGHPPLLSNFGATLIERAVIEAVCKHANLAFAEALRSNALGVNLAAHDDRLAGLAPLDLLPNRPRSTIIARHTVGLADALTDADIIPDKRVDDSLPQSLEACIRRYGLKHFKIKIGGEVEADSDRLQRIADILQREAAPNYAFTFDGNECFNAFDAFQDYWSRLLEVTSLAPFLQRLIFVEQPFHRDIALDASAMRNLPSWRNRPALIIDESGGESDSLTRALKLGYQGFGYKSCKGVFRGVAGACLLAKLRRENPGSSWLLSGEDLGNVGPISLQQDLAVAAALGIESVERNGHHFFAGLSAFPKAAQAQTLQHHSDFYGESEAGWPTVQVSDGEVRLDSINAAPLGVGFELDVEQFTPAEKWRDSVG